jgi:DNA-directed RNA polymerase specialized sigma24 family protein
VSALGSAAGRARLRARGREPDPVADLPAYLAGEYRAGESLRLTSRRSSATGQALSDRMVSRLEVAHALRFLPLRQRRVVELLYQEDMPAAEVAARLGVCVRTVWANRLAALAAMAGVIYEWDTTEPSARAAGPRPRSTAVGTRT